MKRRSSLIIFALASIAISLAACSRTTTNSNNANTSTAASNSSAPPPSTPTSSFASTSPEALLKASFDAAKRQDVEGFKKTISTADLKSLDAALKKSGHNLDDLMKDQLKRPETPMPESLETRDEKIEGERATVEYKDIMGNWKTANFIKEDGEWKIRLDGGRRGGSNATTKSGNTN